MDQKARAPRRKGEITLRRLIAVAFLLQACASPGMPPGGPPDVAAPQIVKIVPDSGTVGVRPKEVLFHFDEVVSERPPGSTNLGDLFIISPRDGVPEASWHRNVIGVKPTHGWRANTPYTVILLKGLSDIRGNVRNTGASTFFSTGKVIPHTRLAGWAFDWVSGSPAGGALIESFVPPDTIHPYVALVDSNGAFAIEHIPAARYTVRAYVDRNKNLGVDAGEPWDSVSINLTDTANVIFVLFQHDTVPPRIAEVRGADSLTLAVRFDKPVDPAQTLTTANFAVIGPDSAPVPISSASPPPKDSVAKTTPTSRVPIPVRAPAGRRDTTVAGRRDTAVVVRPVMPRPIPITEVVIKLQRPLQPKAAYHVRAIGIRGLLGVTGDSERLYTVPAPPPPPTAKPATTPPSKPPPVK